MHRRKPPRSTSHRHRCWIGSSVGAPFRRSCIDQHRMERWCSTHDDRERWTACDCCQSLSRSGPVVVLQQATEPIALPLVQPTGERDQDEPQRIRQRGMALRLPEARVIGCLAPDPEISAHCQIGTQLLRRRSAFSPSDSSPDCPASPCRCQVSGRAPPMWRFTSGLPIFCLIMCLHVAEEVRNIDTYCPLGPSLA